MTPKPEASVYKSSFSLPAWGKLLSLANEIRRSSLAQRFEAEGRQRLDYLSREAVGLRADFSKQHLDRPTLDALLELAQQAELGSAIAQLFEGDLVNNTEGRPAHHTALRDQASWSQPALQYVGDCYQRFTDTAEAIRQGQIKGSDGSDVSDVVHIGMGGSDLGPKLVSTALASDAQPIRTHFVANIDPDQLTATLSGLNPAATLFVVCSKSFTTQETLQNALSARQWLQARLAAPEAAAQHFYAITAATAKATEFGIAPAHIFPMWDWVGGRFSLWSAVGFTAVIAIGKAAFADLLQGAHDMDQHFHSSPLAGNLPVLLGLVDVWNSSFLNISSHAVLPYSHRLRQLPNYLQQLFMESNGKGTDRNGEPVAYTTAPILWGEAGTIGQHSFHQLLHQGTANTNCEFVLPLTTGTPLITHHQQLVASCLSQSLVLMQGETQAQATAKLQQQGYSAAQAAELAPHKVIDGNKASTIISFKQLDPHSLGALLALYEHRTYVSSVIWNINAFDQWGVELGKQISNQLQPALRDGLGDDGVDPSTAALVAAYRQANHLQD